MFFLYSEFIVKKEQKCERKETSKGRQNRQKQATKPKLCCRELLLFGHNQNSYILSIYKTRIVGCGNYTLYFMPQLSLSTFALKFNATHKLYLTMFFVSKDH